MPRVTHVKKAQQRYETRPVLDPETGEQKQVPVMSARTGQQKTTKSGRPVFLRVTERDLDNPLPMPKCDACGEEIAVGTPYKWIEPSGQRVRNRHESCPTWQVWEYSSSLSARIAQIQHDSPTGGFKSVEEAEEWAQSKAEEIRELAEEKRESASNIEEGFGHATYQSDELNETADSLDEWADNIKNVDIPEYPEAEDQDCGECDGTGEEAEDTTCSTCDGTGQVEGDAPTDEQIAAWEQEVIDALQSALDEAPC